MGILSDVVDGVHTGYRKLLPSGSRKSLGSLFSEKSMNREFEDNRASVNTSSLQGSPNPFNDYMAKQPGSLDDFAAKKDSDGKATPFAASLTEQLKTPSDDLVNANLAVKQALTPGTVVKSAQTKFSEKIDAMNNLLRQNGSVNLGAMADYLQKQKSKAKRAIETQHNDARGKVEALFDSSNPANIRAQVQNGMGLADDAAVDKFKNTMLADLDSAHQDELQKLEKTIDDQSNKYLDHHAKEGQRIAYLSTMWKESTATRKKMQELEAQNKGNRGPLQVSYDADTGMAMFKDIDVRDIDCLETITGTPITIQKGATPDQDVYRMELPKYGLLYYRSGKLAMDFDSLAMAVRAGGHDSIIMSVGSKHEETAMEAGRAAYEACLKAGFDPNGKPDPKDPSKTIPTITVKVNGKEMTADQLFADEPKRLQRLRSSYKNSAAQLRAANQNVGKQEARDFKTQVKTERQAANPGSTPPPGSGSSTPPHGPR